MTTLISWLVGFAVILSMARRTGVDDLDSHGTDRCLKGSIGNISKIVDFEAETAGCTLRDGTAGPLIG